jgi:hypothetical protein
VTRKTTNSTKHNAPAHGLQSGADVYVLHPRFKDKNKIINNGFVAMAVEMREIFGSILCINLRSKNHFNLFRVRSNLFARDFGLSQTLQQVI